MEAKELRISNLVNRFGFIYQIASINCDDTLRFKSDDINHQNYSNGTIGCYAINSLSPIPLTEEWLVKFGFKSIDKRLMELEIWNGYAAIRFNKGLSTIGICKKELHGATDLEHCKYVNQLQNLYFALTGEELTIL